MTCRWAAALIFPGKLAIVARFRQRRIGVILSVRLLQSAL
jgi:hypothetical protein